MKILFVCFSYSIHAARWIELSRRADWDVHVFPSQDFDALHSRFTRLTYWPAQPGSFVPGSGVQVHTDSASVRAKTGGELSLAEYLRRVIEQEAFDVVHSLEFQHAAYLTLDALRELPTPHPRWIVTNYGSDILLYREQPDHAERIRAVLARADVYSAECRRDVRLAVGMGFKGQLFDVVPNSAGVDLAKCATLRSPLPPSRRSTIAVKGYEHFAGRALSVLDVLRDLQHLLRGYRVVISSPSSPVRVAAARLAEETGLLLDCLADHEPHERILALHGAARLSIANSISDGISTALLEAMAMGSFPIQSCTSCADEWIVPGETGFITNPEDPASIRCALEEALRNDALVDAAAARNIEQIRRRADQAVLRPRIDLAYARVHPSAPQSAVPDPGSMPARLPRHRPQPLRSRFAAPDRKRAALTVITPSYNRAGFLGETIESVLSQDFEDFEYLVLDDGSQDNTAEVVARYDDPRVRYTRHTNVGETETVNRALRRVRGEFFTIINSDDPAVANSFSPLVDALRRDERLLLVYPDWFLIDETSAVRSIVRIPDFDLSRLFISGSVPVGPGAMFRSTVLEKVGFRDPLLKYCADLDYVYRTALAGPIAHLPQVLGTHRTHPGSASLSDRGTRLARESAYPATVHSLHPSLTGIAARLHSHASATGFFAGSFATPDASLALQLLARALMTHPTTTLRLVSEHGIEQVAERLRSLGFRRGDTHRGDLDRALSSYSRQAALKPFLRAVLTDPLGVLDELADIGTEEVERRVRAMPVRG